MRQRRAEVYSNHVEVVIILVPIVSLARQKRDRRLGAVWRHWHELEHRASCVVSHLHGWGLGRQERAR